MVEVGTGPGDLYAAAEELLAAAHEAVASTDAGAQPRFYVSPGLPVWDCAQLTCHVGAAALADTAPLQPPLQPGAREGMNIALRLVQFTVTTLRCVPVVGGQGVKLPTPAAMSAAAKTVDDDVWAIWNHLAYLKRNGLLFPPAKTRAMFFDPAISVLTQGGIGGFQLQFRVEIPAYPETGGS